MDLALMAGAAPPGAALVLSIRDLIVCVLLYVVDGALEVDIGRTQGIRGT